MDDLHNDDVRGAGCNAEGALLFAVLREVGSSFRPWLQPCRASYWWRSFAGANDLCLLKPYGFAAGFSSVFAGAFAAGFIFQNSGFAFTHSSGG